ncbi:PAS domain-containing protein [Halorhabdus sp. CBA1104]|uniref:PAS domain-containing protein n=1 Tax=Halorhabdus sp. CBA1104 TaxID=1380432 RepID=UPI0012B283CC|nr:PAS domain-containing protein [Halorhabdus sp. CBA1104]QGN07777.1 PAS domain-containing protein [Halorhabdus sp. CBA1104]
MVLFTALRLGMTALAAGVAVGLFAALLADRERASARALLGVSVAVVVGTVCHLLVADLTPPNAALAVTGWDFESTTWVLLATATAVIVGGLWVLFAFRYTGRSRRLNRVTTGIVAVVSVGTIGIVAVTIGDPSTIAFQLLTVTYLLIGFLVTIGVFLLVWLSVGQQAVPLREPLLLSAGAVVLVSGSFVAQVFERPLLLPVCTSIGSGLLLVAVCRYPVFETPPAARVLGRDRVVEELADAVLISDRRGRLRDLNPAAQRVFDVSRASVLGDSIASLFPSAIDPESLARAEEPIRIELAEETTLSVTADVVTDDRGRSFGHLVRCTDVTDQRRREDQLTLLSRFVVDVMRDRMVAVAQEASPQAATATDTGAVADRIWTDTTELTTLIAQTRSIERAIAEGPASADQRLAVEPVVQDLQESIAAADDRSVAVAVQGEAIDTTVSQALLSSLLEPVLADACSHAATRVEISVASGEPTIRIADDRPVATDRGGRRRTPALPLAVTRLALDQLGGSLSVRRTDAGRRLVVLALPHNETREDGHTVVTGGAGR